MAVISPTLPLIGGGKTKFQPVYIGDVAAAVMASVDKVDAIGKTYELAGPSIYSFRELMEMMLSEIGRRRLLVPISYGIADSLAGLAEGAVKFGDLLGLQLPPPLTKDQVAMLRRDNVASGNLPGLKDLGVSPTALELILPTYLDCYRVGGRYLKPKSS